MTGTSVQAAPAPAVDLPYVGDLGARFPTRTAVDLAAALLDAQPGCIDPKVGVVRRYAVRVGPGLVQVLTQARGNGPGDWQTTHRKDCRAYVVQGASCSMPERCDRTRRVRGCHGCPFVTPAEVAPRRGSIFAWSAKSRTNMVRTMTSLDWSPVVDAGDGWRPAMVTLTLPGEWESLAPDAATFWRYVEALKMRWRRRWGRPIAGVWKKEYQRRGAPHLHVYCAVPASRTFQDWLSRAWYEIVGSGDERHLRAGTGVDWREGIRASDPKRLGVYFAKRASAHNTAASKEYQHAVPMLWMASGGGGRFWGVWGLDRATADVELDRVQFVQLRRLMRRHVDSQGRRAERRRRVVDTETGEIRAGRKVTRRYRVRSLQSGERSGGFVLHNDAPRWVEQAAGWVALAAGDRIQDVRQLRPMLP